MSRSPSPHMVLALQAGVVSQEQLDALTAVDDKLSSACLFAEYWDTHLDRDAWLQQHVPPQLHSLAVPLHQWCCKHSASWARGAVHIPVFSSAPSCQPTAPSSSITTGVTGSKRRYAAITSGGRHRQQQSSSLPPDGPLLSEAAREQEEYQQVLEVTLNLIASLGQLPGLLQELSSSTLCSVRQIARLRKIISATAPSAGTLRAHNLSFKRFLLCRQKTVTVRVFPQNYQYRRCRFHGKVGIPRFFGAKIHCIEFSLVGQILGCACFIFSHSKCHHGRDQNFSQRP